MLVTDNGPVSACEPHENPRMVFSRVGRVVTPSLGEVGVLDELLPVLSGANVLLPGLDVSEFDTSSCINVHHEFLITVRHDLDVLWHRECIVELTRGLGIAVLDIFFPGLGDQYLMPGSKNWGRQREGGRELTSHFAVHSHMDSGHGLGRVLLLRLTAVFFELPWRLVSMRRMQ